MTITKGMTMQWVPRTEEDLVSAATAGTLDENTVRAEFKQQVPTTDAGRRALAEELSSLAVDGGVLVVGVVDPKNRSNPTDPHQALAPVLLAGEPERIEQIALARCDPPLFVRITALPAAAHPGSGYLVVEVPSSSLAPHMVGGSYWGRGDTTKRRLTDAEVVRLHERRRALDQDAREALTVYVERDPWVISGRKQEHTHLFVVAEPRGGRPDMLLDVAVDGPGWQGWCLDLVHRRANQAPTFGQSFAPDLNYATNLERRPVGWAGTSYDLVRQPSESASEDHLLEVELSFDGGVRLFCGRGSDDLESSGGEVVFEQLIAGLAYRTVCIAADVSLATNFHGEWALGVAMTGLANARSWILHHDFRASGSPLRDPTYEYVTRSPSAALEDEPRAVTGRLVTRLIRTLGTERRKELEPFMAVPS